MLPSEIMLQEVLEEEVQFPTAALISAAYQLKSASEEGDANSESKETFCEEDCCHDKDRYSPFFSHIQLLLSCRRRCCFSMRAKGAFIMNKGHFSPVANIASG